MSKQPYSYRGDSRWEGHTPMSGVRLPRPLLLLQHLPDTPTQAGTVRRREGSGFLYVFVFIKKSLARKNYSLKEWSFNCFPKLAFNETEFRFWKYIRCHDYELGGYFRNTASAPLLIDGPFWTDTWHNKVKSQQPSLGFVSFILFGCPVDRLLKSVQFSLIYTFII